MLELFYARILIINYAAGTANVLIGEREGQMITGVPLLLSNYELPRVGDVVAVVLDSNQGKVGKGVVLGTISAKN